MQAKRGDIVQVTWLDAWGNSHGRHDPGYDYGPITMRHVGYLVQENEEGLVTCVKQQSGGVSYDGETFIPWEMILEWEVLE